MFGRLPNSLFLHCLFSFPLFRKTLCGFSSLAVGGSGYDKLRVTNRYLSTLSVRPTSRSKLVYPENYEKRGKTIRASLFVKKNVNAYLEGKFRCKVSRFLSLGRNFGWSLGDENNFSILVFRLHIITTHTHPMSCPLWLKLGLWKRHWFETRKTYSYSISYS